MTISPGIIKNRSKILSMIEGQGLNLPQIRSNITY